MDIDFKGIMSGPINDLFVGLLNVLGIPFVIAIILILVLGAFKFTRKIASSIGAIVFLILVYVQFMRL